MELSASLPTVLVAAEAGAKPKPEVPRPPDSSTEPNAADVEQFVTRDEAVVPVYPIGSLEHATSED